jgi:beta-lactamase class A
MTHSPHRRTMLLTAAALPFAALSLRAAAGTAATHADDFPALEHDAGGRLGVFAIDTATGKQVGHREDERFPVCSTFKLILVGAVLTRSVTEPTLMQQRLRYSSSDVVIASPITSAHAGDGMTVTELCAATLQVSDDTAANVLMKMLGGPAAVTSFARSISNPTFRLDRWEPALNTAIPGDPRDTATPAAMGHSTQTLVLGDALPAPQRRQLKDWLIGCKTGQHRIRAGVPPTWTAGDKTGTGDYGTTNDLAVLWPDASASVRGPIVLGVYYTQGTQNAQPRDDVIAAAARIAVRQLG